MPLCYKQSTLLKICSCFLLSDVQHLETETLWETMVMLITVWFSRRKMPRHILNATAQAVEPALFILHWPSCLSKPSPSLLLSFSSQSFTPGEGSWMPQSHIASHFKCVSSSHAFVSFSLLFSQESWCHFKESMSWETLWAPISFSLLSLLLYSYRFFLSTKAKAQCMHLKASLSVIASPNFFFFFYKLALLQSPAQSYNKSFWLCIRW